MKRIPCAMLALALLLSTAACGGTTSTDTTTDTMEEYHLPEGDFGGREVNFYVSSNRSLIQSTEETGDVINDAVYRRNRKVEEEYNVVFRFTTTTDTGAEFPAWYSTLQSSIMAGDNSIDIVGGYFYRLAALSLTDGLFQNLNDLSQVSFDQPWWIQGMQDAATVGSKLYITAGNIEPGFYNRIYAMVFNKELAEECQTGDLYSLVEKGKWTFDQLKKIAKSASADLNGDAKMDEADRYGYITGWYMSLDAYNNAFDIRFIENNDSGVALLPLGEHAVDAISALREFMWRSGDAYCVEEVDFPNGNYYTMFEEGRGLVMSIGLLNLQKMRDFDLDFGILPYPKWDEAQDDYISFSAVDPVAGYCVPVTTDSELAGCMLEALAYYGYQDVLPEYYERALKGKNTRDSESEAMLDIIFSSIRYDFSNIYSYAFGDQKAPTMLTRSVIRFDKDISSAYAADATMYGEALENILASLK